MAHLKEVDQGYWKHMGYALRWAYLLCVAGVLGIVHAILPFMWTDVMSSITDQVDGEIKKAHRIKKTKSRKKSGR